MCTLSFWWVLCPACIFTLSIISACCRSYETWRKKPAMWSVLGSDALSAWGPGCWKDWHLFLSWKLLLLTPDWLSNTSARSLAVPNTLLLCSLQLFILWCRLLCIVRTLLQANILLGKNLRVTSSVSQNFPLWVISETEANSYICEGRVGKRGGLAKRWSQPLALCMQHMG